MGKSCQKKQEYSEFLNEKQKNRGMEEEKKSSNVLICLNLLIFDLKTFSYMGGVKGHKNMIEL